MKYKYLTGSIFALAIMAMLGFTSLKNESYYYAYNEKVYLEELDNKIVVRYNHNKKSDKKKMSLYSELADKHIEWKDDSTCVITLPASSKAELKERIKLQSDVKLCNPVYKVNPELEMSVTDEVLIKPKDDTSQKELEKLHKKYGIEVAKITSIYQKLKVPAGFDALEIANIYQESGLVVFSHPNFICEDELYQVIPNDTYFANLFNLNNTGQVFTDGHSGTNDADIDAPEAWMITQGDNDIVIAVLDQGVTPNHPDLPNARQIRLNGSNFADDDPNNPSPTANGNHGNMCAGIIAATQNNNQGISGIAPNCRIMPIRKYNTDGSAITAEGNALAIQFAWQNGADILSCSWGYNSDNPNLHPVIREAIIEATTQGRDGLGCVVAFAASNSADHVDGINGEVRFPANVDVPGVLTVGASDRDDLQANYSPLSNPGSSNNQMIDIVAPSHRAYSTQIENETLETWSIDIPGNAGYNEVHNTDGGTLPVVGSVLPNAGVNNLAYTGRCGGTSYACPQVAATAALILSVNPNLTQLEVFDILTTTTDQVGGYVYTDGFSNELGFGRLNANQAVRAVIANFDISGEDNLCDTESYSIDNLPPGWTVSWTNNSDNLIELSGNTNEIYTLQRLSSNGSALIAATIDNVLGDFITTLEKNIWIGKPDIPTTNPSGYPTYQLTLGQIKTISLVTAPGAGSQVGDWGITGSIFQTSPNPTGLCTVQATSLGTGNFRVTTQNRCGTSIAGGGTVYVSSGGGGGILLGVTPNPAKDYVNIEIRQQESDTETVQQNLYEKYTVRLINQYQIPVYQNKFANKQFTINLSGFKTGVYYLQVFKGKEMYSERIIISK